MWNKSRTVKVGHVPAVIIDDLPPADDRVAVSLNRHCDDEGRCINLRILVSREPVSMRDLPDCEQRAGWKRRTVERLKRQAALLEEPWPEGDDPVEQMAKMFEDLQRKPDGNSP